MSIDNTTRHALQQFRMGNAIEIAAQIRVYHLRVARVQQAVDRPNCVVCLVRVSLGDFLPHAAWNWHAHHIAATEPMAWIDGLDIPFAYFTEG